jgi:hypothetical protein
MKFKHDFALVLFILTSFYIETQAITETGTQPFFWL